MNDYVVSWTVEVSARSPKEAAIAAFQMMRDPESLATVFEVRPFSSMTDEHYTFDLSPEDALIEDASG